MHGATRNKILLILLFLISNTVYADELLVKNPFEIVSAIKNSTNGIKIEDIKRYLSNYFDQNHASTNDFMSIEEFKLVWSVVEIKIENVQKKTIYPEKNLPQEIIDKINNSNRNNFNQIVRKLDLNNDKQITNDEFVNLFANNFSEIDLDKNLILTNQEINEYEKKLVSFINKNPN